MANQFAARCEIYIKNYHTASDVRRSSAWREQGHPPSLHVIDISFFLRLRVFKLVAHGSSCRLEDNSLNWIVKDFTAIIPTR